MLSREPFRIRLSIDGKIKDIISIYYKHIGYVPIFSCNELNQYRMVNLHGKGNIIIIGSDILSKLEEQDIEVIVWSLVIKQYTGFNNTEQDIKDITYIDTLMTNLFEINTLTNTLRHIRDNIILGEKHKNLITYRINYLENKVFKNFNYKNICIDNILREVNLIQISEVA